MQVDKLFLKNKNRPISSRQEVAMGEERLPVFQFSVFLMPNEHNTFISRPPNEFHVSIPVHKNSSKFDDSID